MPVVAPVEPVAVAPAHLLAELPRTHLPGTQHTHVNICLMLVSLEHNTPMSVSASFFLLSVNFFSNMNNCVLALSLVLFFLWLHCVHLELTLKANALEVSVPPDCAVDTC